MKKYHLLIIAAIILFLGCTKNETNFEDVGATLSETYPSKISGNIVDKDGKQVIGAIVTSQKDGITSSTNDVGNFTLSGLSEGEHEILVYKSGYFEAVMDTVVISLADSIEIPEEKSLIYRFSKIRGNIYNRDGTHFIGAMAGVTIEGQDVAEVAVAGNIIIDNVEGSLDKIDTIKIQVFGDGVGIGEIEVAIQPDSTYENVNVTFSKYGGTVEGTLLDSLSTPIAGALIYVVEGITTKTAEDGTFTLNNVPSDAEVSITIELNGVKMVLGGILVTEEGELDVDEIPFIHIEIDSTSPFEVIASFYSNELGSDVVLIAPIRAKEVAATEDRSRVAAGVEIELYRWDLNNDSLWDTTSSSNRITVSADYWPESGFKSVLVQAVASNGEESPVIGIIVDVKIPNSPASFNSKPIDTTVTTLAPISLTLTATDTDIGDTLTFMNENGTSDLLVSGDTVTITFTPTAFDTTYELSVSVTDGKGAKDVASWSVTTVGPIDDTTTDSSTALVIGTDTVTLLTDYREIQDSTWIYDGAVTWTGMDSILGGYATFTDAVKSGTLGFDSFSSTSGTLAKDAFIIQMNSATKTLTSYENNGDTVAILMDSVVGNIFYEFDDALVRRELFTLSPDTILYAYSYTDLSSGAMFVEMFKFVKYSGLISHPDWETEPLTYALTITSNDTTMGFIGSTKMPSYSINDTVAIMAEANGGYEFDYWGGADSAFVDNVNLNSTFLLMPAKNVAIQAVFKVAPNTAPTNITLSLNTTTTEIYFNQQIGLLSATDDFGGDMDYKIKGGKDSIYFAISVDTLKTIDNMIDMGVPFQNQEGDSTYLVDIIVTDTGGLSCTTEVSIVVSSGGPTYDSVFITQISGGDTSLISQSAELVGNTVNISSTPISGFVFNHWDGTDTTLLHSAITVDANSFEMPGYPVNLTAVFVVVNTTPTDILITSNSMHTSGNVGALIGTLSATDAEGGVMTYEITGGSDSSYFNIVASDSTLKLATAAPTSNQTLYVEITVTDNNSNTFPEMLEINISDFDFGNYLAMKAIVTANNLQGFNINDAVTIVADSVSQLDLSGNGLTTLPSEIANLINLTTLNLSNNNLTALPVEIGTLTALESLDLGFNDLTDLPVEITNLQNLTYLNLHQNRLYGSYPLWEIWASDFAEQDWADNQQ